MIILSPAYNDISMKFNVVNIVFSQNDIIITNEHLLKNKTKPLYVYMIKDAWHIVKTMITESSIAWSENSQNEPNKQ